MKKLIFICALLLTVVACKDTTETPDAEPTVYVVGAEHTDDRQAGPAYAMLWRNGEAIRLTDGKNYAAAYGICEDGEDIYVCGHEMDGETDAPVYGRIWKNGKPFVSLTTASTISKICFANGVRYTIGIIDSETGIGCPVLWIDSKEQLLDFTGYDTGIAYSIQVVGKDIYIGGCVTRSDAVGRYTMPVIWKNGVRQDLCEQPHDHTALRGIAVSSTGTVYACGAVQEENIYWENGVAKSLNSNGVAQQMFLSEGDVYITGVRSTEANVQVGQLWKNGTVLYTISGDEFICNTNASCKFGNDLYTVGEVLNAEDHTTTRIWKNGSPFANLTKGDKGSEANAILVH